MRPFVAAVACSAIAIACSDPTAPPSPPPAAERSLVASKLVTLAIGLATARDGGGPFDNVMACPRRGLATYYNSTAGRHVVFHGCDAGDGVVVSGSAEVRWPNAHSYPWSFTSITMVGDVRVGTSTTAESAVGEVSATGITFTGDEFSSPSPRLLDPSAATISAFGETYAFQSAASVDNVLFPTLTIDAIPNASGVDGLSENDVRRLALDGGMYLGRVLLNETLESGRGEHTHTLPCGTLHVVPEGQFVRMDAVWNSCATGTGLFISGTFTARWTKFTEPEMKMVITGQPTFGGGVPKVTLGGMEWNFSGFVDNADTYELTVAGALLSATARRNYSFKYTVDD
jgi:hypothetical protein